MNTRTQPRLIAVLSVALLISLCLNLFAAGTWLTGLWLQGSAPIAVERALAGYPVELRREVARRLLTDREAVRTAVQALREARQTMLAQMRAEPLDRAELDAAMADVRTATTALQARVHLALGASIEQAPAHLRSAIHGDSPDQSGWLELTDP